MSHDTVCWNEPFVVFDDTCFWLMKTSTFAWSRFDWCGFCCLGGWGKSKLGWNKMHVCLLLAPYEIVPWKKHPTSHPVDASGESSLHERHDTDHWRKVSAIESARNAMRVKTACSRSVSQICPHHKAAWASRVCTSSGWLDWWAPAKMSSWGLQLVRLRSFWFVGSVKAHVQSFRKLFGSMVYLSLISHIISWTCSAKASPRTTQSTWLGIKTAIYI